MSLVALAELLDFIGRYAASLTFLLFLGWLVYSFHSNPRSYFNISDLVLDHKTGKVSDSKFRMNVAFALMSWVLVYLTLSQQLTEWYVTAYVLAWVADRKFARDNAKNTPPVA